MEDNSKRWLLTLADFISLKVLVVAISSIGFGVFLVLLSFDKAEASIYFYLLREVGKAIFITAIITGALKWYMVRQIRNLENARDGLIRHSLSQSLEDLKGNVIRQTQEVAAYVKSLDDMKAAGVSRFYRNRSEAADDIKRTLSDPEISEVRVIGISLNDFVRDEKAALHDAWRAIESRIRRTARINNKETIDVKVLIIDPHCQGAHLRANSEESSDVRSRLVPDVMMAMEQFLDLMNEVNSQIQGDNAQETKEEMRPSIETKPIVRFEAKLYRVAPIAYLVWTPNVAYFQPYYFRQSHQSNVNIPLLKCDSQLADTLDKRFLHEEMKFHFDWIWSHASIGIGEYLSEYSIGTDHAIRQASIENIFYEPELSKKRILSVISNAKTFLWIKGVSLRSFFQLGEIFQAIQNACHREGLSIRVMVIDPECEQAKYRSFREHLIFNADATLENFVDEVRHNQPLYRDTTQTIENIRHLQEDLKSARSKGDFSAKVFTSAPEAFVLQTESTVLIEQYHYGKVRLNRERDDNKVLRAMILGTDIPVLEYKVIDNLPVERQLRDPYRIIRDHMEYVYQYCCSPLPCESRSTTNKFENPEINLESDRELRQ